MSGNESWGSTWPSSLESGHRTLPSTVVRVPGQQPLPDLFLGLGCGRVTPEDGGKGAAIRNLAGGRGLGHHLDCIAAAPGGQSERWPISGTGPQCAALWEEETKPLRSLHSGLPKIL